MNYEYNVHYIAEISHGQTRKPNKREIILYIIKCQ